MTTTRIKERKITEKTHQLDEFGIKEKYGSIGNYENGGHNIHCNGTENKQEV